MSAQPQRTGLIGKKLGMTQLFDNDGNQIMVTAIKADGCRVVGHRTNDNDGYTAVRLGNGEVKTKNMSKPERGQYAKAGVEPMRRMVEFRVSEDALVDIGAQISVDHFAKGQYVDITGTSKGKGFAGAMKRHGFGGMRATHGTSTVHRHLGSTGQCQDPGKVFKGKKMPGHMGNATTTMINLQVVDYDTEEGVIFVKGSVPGPKNGWVVLSDAVKKALKEDAPFPAAVIEEEVAEEEPEAEEASVEENGETTEKQTADQDEEQPEDTEEKSQEADDEDTSPTDEDK
jgi:large subunit ribosomal protein L3